MNLEQLKDVKDTMMKQTSEKMDAANNNTTVGKCLL